MRRVLIGHIPIDSACVVIADPGVLREFDSETRNLEELLPPGCPDLNHMRRCPVPELPFSREACWVAQSSRERGGILGAQHGDAQRFGSGVAVSTGLGDGLYPVYADIVEPGDVDPDEVGLVGRVARVLVDFVLVGPEDDAPEGSPNDPGR
jgi:hypothetical protein